MRARSGDGLIVAGVIVTLVGLVIVAIRELGLPRHWVPVLVGVALVVAGLIRRLSSRRRD
ncbi:MAG TPA: hypothetical protein VFX28_21940 [Methylomirabilota bacterium]|nr:hypothetical protein [Methylomirabilota bacterium]